MRRFFARFVAFFKPWTPILLCSAFRYLGWIQVCHDKRLQQAMLFNRGAEFQQFGVIIAKNPAWLAWIRNDAVESGEQNSVLVDAGGLLCGHDFGGARYQGIKSAPQAKFLLSHGTSPPLLTPCTHAPLENWGRNPGWIGQNLGPHSGGHCG